MIEKQTSKEIKYLRTDNGLEFCSNEFNKFCRENEITRHITVIYTSTKQGYSLLSFLVKNIGLRLLPI